MKCLRRPRLREIEEHVFESFEDYEIEVPVAVLVGIRVYLAIGALVRFRRRPRVPLWLLVGWGR